MIHSKTVILILGNLQEQREKLSSYKTLTNRILKKAIEINDLFNIILLAQNT